MTAIAIAQIVIQLLPGLETGVTEAIAFINSIRGAAQQSGDWTPAMEAAFEQALIDTGTAPAYQPDPPAKP